ncbi:type VI secretion system contractile sheath large subunit [Pendulispora albinea]|uniref:Type VI secretion system contractile sheath large subunit n=1 Tax=Pendulispora albinea TaxID=2741071 RepID=A0ABZ2M515_9BACT
MTAADTVTASSPDDMAVESLIAQLAGSPDLTDWLIAKLDERIGRQVDVILHHPKFQALESAWRGLKFVVDRVDFTENIRIKVWNYSKEELRSDLAENPDPTKSWLYRIVYSEEYGQHGGEPYTAIFAPFAMTSSPEDLDLLRGMASVAAMAHAPIFLDLDPLLFGVASYEELTAMTDLHAVFDTPQMSAWNRFRETEDSRYVGLLLPRMLLRLPHRDVDQSDGSAESFVYNERIDGIRDHLWGSATYAFGVRLADSHARHRTAMGVLGTFDDEPPVRDWHAAMNSDACKPPVDVVLSRKKELALAELGFIALTCDPVEGSLRFATASSLQKPKVLCSDHGPQATLNYYLGTQIPYLLFISLFAHFVKIIQREHLGGHHTAGELASDLTTWIRQFVNRAENPPAAMRLRFPLRSAKVDVREIDGQPGWYHMNLIVRPHMRYKGAEFELSVPGRLDRR